MDCDQLERLSLWLDGELPPAHEQVYAEHLAGCSVCSTFREEFLRLRAELRKDSPPVNPFYQSRALAAILHPAKGASWWRWVEVPTPALVALIFAVLSLGWIALSGNDSSVEPELTVRPLEEGAPIATPEGFDFSRFDRGERIVLQKIRKPASGSTR